MSIYSPDSAREPQALDSYVPALVGHLVSIQGFQRDERPVPSQGKKHLWVFRDNAEVQSLLPSLLSALANDGITANSRFASGYITIETDI